MKITNFILVVLFLSVITLLFAYWTYIFMDYVTANKELKERNDKLYFENQHLRAELKKYKNVQFGDKSY